MVGVGCLLDGIRWEEVAISGCKRLSPRGCHTSDPAQDGMVVVGGSNSARGVPSQCFKLLCVAGAIRSTEAHAWSNNQTRDHEERHWTRRKVSSDLSQKTKRSSNDSNIPHIGYLAWDYSNPRPNLKVGHCDGSMFASRTVAYSNNVELIRSLSNRSGECRQGTWGSEILSRRGGKIAGCTCPKRR